MRFEIPGKTFLLGEYAALAGHGAIVACTNPGFTANINRTVTGALPEGSPAWKFQQRHGDFFSGQSVQFESKVSGGWGASTAQYLAVYTAVHGPVVSAKDREALLREYHADAWDGHGAAPSGADLIAQTAGGVVHYNRRHNVLQNLSWNFSDLTGFLVKTGRKVATHEHLRDLTSIDTTGMEEIVLRGVAAMTEGDTEGFVECVSEYSRALQQRSLTCESTLSLLHDFLWLDGVRAAKGCGALGADVVFVVVDTEASARFSRWLSENHWRHFELPKDLSESGLRIVPEGPEEVVDVTR